MKNRTRLRRIMAGVMGVTVGVGATMAYAAQKEGLIEYIGAQRDIFKSGKATPVIDLESMADRSGLYAVGPVEGLDGEITIFDSQPYITQVRGDDFQVDRSFAHGAFFLVWSEQKEWQDVPIPADVKGYVDLQRFVKERAQASGIDATKPFPFLLAGTPTEIKWHINVDRTAGKPITKELFYQSKQPYLTRDEPVDIVGFYAEHHTGDFVAQTAPAIKADSGVENSIHIHLISRSSKAAGHIDDITLGEGMVLRLPKK